MAQVALLSGFMSVHQSASSRVTVLADWPLAFEPSNASSASVKSPVDTPLR